MKKVMTSAFAASLLLGTIASTSFADASSSSFSDIEKSYAKDAIIELQSKGILNGVDGTKFNPKGILTRAEYVTIIVKALELSIETGGQSSFTDVSGWAAPYVAAAVQAGIVDGVGGGKFDPNASVTREMATVILVRALQAAGVILEDNTDPLTFTDAKDISAWAKDYIAVAVRYGLIKGNPDGSFSPKGKASREMAAILGSNLLTAIKNTAPDPTKPEDTQPEKPETTPTTPSTTPSAPSSGGSGGSGGGYIPPTTPPVTEVPNSEEFVKPQDFGYWVDATPDSAAYNVGFDIDLDKLPYSKISKIQISLVDGSNNVLATRTATGGQIDKLKADDGASGELDGQLSAAFIYREAAATNEWWNSTAYDFATPVKAVISITDNTNKVYVVKNDLTGSSSGEVSNPQEYLSTQDFGYWNDQLAYNLGFKIDVEKLPYAKMKSIEVALVDGSGNVLATRTATGTQIAKLAADDETYGPIDGQLSVAFVSRDAEGVNEWWNSSSYDMTAPAKAVVTITDKSNRIIKIESGNPSTTAPVYVEMQDFGALPDDGYNLGFKLNLDALGGYDNIASITGSIADADGEVSRIAIDTEERINNYKEADSADGMSGQLSLDFRTQTYVMNEYGGTETTFTNYIKPIADDYTGTPTSSQIVVVTKSGATIVVNR